MQKKEARATIEVNVGRQAMLKLIHEVQQQLPSTRQWPNRKAGAIKCGAARMAGASRGILALVGQV